MTQTTWQRGPYRISTDPNDLDLECIHTYLAESYWAQGIPRAVVAKSLEHSLNFGLYTETEQVGFARVVTDFATFMYLADVFVLKAHQGQGLGVWLMEVVMNHSDLTGVRTWLLKTKDAHGLYEKFDFVRPEDADACARFMQRRVPYPYLPGEPA